MEKAATLAAAEQQLLREHQDLEIRIKERTSELAKANEDLESELAARRQAEIALKESERRHRELTDFLPISIFEIDTTGRITSFNRTALGVFRYNEEDYNEDMNALQFFPPEEWQRLGENISKVIQGTSVLGEEYTFLRKDGSSFIGLTYSSPNIHQDKTVGIRGAIIDITERKRADTELRKAYQQLRAADEQMQAQYNSLVESEQSLRESEEKYRNILESIDEAYFEINLKGDLTFFNDSACNISGYSKSELMGMNYRQYSSPETAKMLRVVFNKIYQTGERERLYDFELITKDKGTRNMELSVNLMRNSAGEAIGFRCTARDITERKQAEMARRESESLYRLLADNMTDTVWLMDMNLNTTYASPSAGKMRGYTEEEIKQLPLDKHLTPASLKVAKQLFSDQMSKVMADPTHVVAAAAELEFYRKDGTTFWLECMFKTIQDEKGKYVSILGEGRDITERKRAEEALHQSEEKYRAIIENMEEGYIEVDIKGRLTFFNEAALNFLGYSREETVGMHYKKYTDEENARKILEAYSGVYRTGLPLPLFEWEVIRKDGTRRTVEGSASLISGTGGRPVGFRGLFRDITDRRRLQDEHIHLQERLHRAEKMEALGTLAGGVAHDLNNVLGVLVGYSELLLQSIPQESPFQRHAMQIFKGSLRAAAIIQDLLTLARRGVLVSETLNLNSIISDFLQMPEFEAIRSHHPGVTFKTSLDGELLNVKGSSTHLSKTVMNLLSNAAEAISGLGEVLITTENRYIDRTISGHDTTQEGEYAVLTVSDTGSGISPADIERIFEPFYTKKVMGRSGTGLGLAVVWGTVKDHDGYIDVQSTEGEGSIFTLYFPVTREDLTKAEQVVPQSTYMGRGEHILVVDDVEGQRLLASAMLEGLGYKVSSVASGEEAIEFLRNNPIDLLILDMIMDPGIDGLDTYRSILDIRPQQKAIIVSGFSETDRVHAAHALGAGAYVRKPYVIEKLGLAVRKELDRK
jgi:PAS domain S-box-containing protein